MLSKQAVKDIADNLFNLRNLRIGLFFLEFKENL